MSKIENPNVEEMVLEDLETAQSQISRILTGKEQNRLVMDADFDAPTVQFNEVVPLDDKYGEFQHYKKIRDTMELVLTTGKIPKEKVPDLHVPAYLQYLVQ
ncbi:hypothetical protein GOV06_05560 [Candidatus Woesearchaeota archaeon]|nr:hypothetical protein [Candidatus Woesearchaeota archaeon]